MNKLIEQLNQLDKDELVAFIAQLQGESSTLDQRIALLVTKHSVCGRIALLKKRVQRLKGEQQFISYRDCGSFESELAELVTAMAELVEQQQDTKAVFSLVDGLMQSHVNVIERVEDSCYVGDLYQQSAELWLKAASQLRQVQEGAKATQIAYDWPQLVLARFEDNGYAVWDHLLENSLQLLTVDELKQLALHFENTIHTAQKNPSQGEHYSYAAGCASTGLEGVAIALNDPDLLEKNLQLRSPEPNELQKMHLARTLLNLGYAQRAITWLQGEWTGYARHDQHRLLDACYQAAGDSDALVQLRRERYEVEPDAANLRLLIEVSSPQERQILKLGSVAKALGIAFFSTRINTLLELGALDEAAEQIIANTSELDTTSYVAADWAKSLAKQGYPLAAVVCYRVLIDSTLKAARSKSYHYAVSYLKKLCALDTAINDYQGHLAHREYVGEVRAQHARKSAFWSKIDFELP